MMPLLEAGLEEGTAYQFLNQPPGWVTALLIIPGILLFVGWIYRRENASSAARNKWLMAGLRIAA